MLDPLKQEVDLHQLEIYRQQLRRDGICQKILIKHFRAQPLFGENSQDPLDVWGTGLQARDFIHIDDCIQAFFVAMKNIKDGSGINIGSGELTSFIEVIKLFCEIEGYEPKINKLTNKPVGVMNRYSDNKKLKKMGWEQKISNKAGFARVLNHIKSKL